MPGVPRVARTMVPALALVLALVLAACGTATPVASFDPASACTTDGRMPGAYPELEALLPAAYEGKAPATVDSGRNCTPAALGTLRRRGHRRGPVRGRDVAAGRDVRAHGRRCSRATDWTRRP